MLVYASSNRLAQRAKSEVGVDCGLWVVGVLLPVCHTHARTLARRLIICGTYEHLIHVWDLNTCNEQVTHFQPAQLNSRNFGSKFRF
jgi:hypothetical protein